MADPPPPSPTGSVDEADSRDGPGGMHEVETVDLGDGVDPEDPAEAAGAAREVDTVEAVEAAFEGVPGAVSMGPTSTVPALGGELLLPQRSRQSPTHTTSLTQTQGQTGTGTVLPPGTATTAGTSAERPAGGAEGIDGDLDSDTVRTGLLQAGPLAIAGLLANGAALIVTVGLARLLTTRGYGFFNQLNGLFLIVSMPGAAVAVAVVRRVTGWTSPSTVRRWAGRVHAQGTMAVLVFAVAVFAARGAIAAALGQHSTVAVVATLVAGAVWILLCLDRGLLQAHRNYRVLAANLLVEGGARLFAILAFVAAGFGVGGAMVGLFVGEVITCLHARLMADRVWAVQVEALRAEAGGAPRGRPRRDARTRLTVFVARSRSLVRPAPDLVGARDERRVLATDLGTAFVALGMTALLQNIDVIVVARENTHLSGSYAAVSVACKALVFGAVVVGGYLLPEAAIRWRQGSHALRQLAVTLLVLAVPATVLLLASLTVPRLLLSVVFSSKYLGATRAFLPLTLAMIFLSLTVVLTMYLLAIGRRWITPLLVCGGIVATVAVVRAGGAPVATARADLAVQATLAALTLVGFVKVHHRRSREA